MSKPEELAKELCEELIKVPSMQIYLELKELLENDDNLRQMREDIARLASEGKKAEKEALLERYNLNPLVNNFNVAKEEVKNLLSQVSDIISD